ncbi:hypothetical protein DPMN_163505 [Dreissena polymorpha]|uniref:Uncharacterized protein n=1 Tax=Dreissena polymorpha TaxID=45954 RepID=A0A9D4EWW9_DREPO|nr:hypothetical protein DPMN_163505 [Dreissena polymorpha]
MEWAHKCGGGGSEDGVGTQLWGSFRGWSGHTTVGEFQMMEWAHKWGGSEDGVGTQMGGLRMEWAHK